MSAATVSVATVTALALEIPGKSTVGAPPRPGMVRIAAGEFTMGDDEGEFDERPARHVRVRAFDLDRDEVTAGQYARCVEQQACAAPTRPTPAPEVAARWVRWTDAAAYCTFVGKRLPTEAEWERAARSTDGRAYPWGNAPECARANFGNYRGEGRCPDNPGGPSAPGRHAGGSSAEGVRDLAGNVWEWVADWYDARYYEHGPSDDPAGPRTGTRRSVRGGACCSMFGLPRAANRVAFPPEYSDEDIGFRCAADAR